MFIKKFTLICLSLIFLLIVFHGTIYAAYDCSDCGQPNNPACGDNEVCTGGCGVPVPGIWTSVGASYSCNIGVGFSTMWCCSVSTWCCIVCNPGDCGTPLPAEVCGNGSCAGGEDCSSCSADCGSCCSNSSPAAPVLSSPVNGTQILKNVSRSFVWTHTDWGTNCSGNSNSYTICFGASCYSSGTTTSYSWTPAVVGSIPWNVNANNGAASATSLTWNVCVEGFNAANPAYVSAWTPACGSQTRTCTENCGTDDCALVALTNCQHCAPTLGAWGNCDINHKQTRSCTENDGLCDGNDCALETLTRDCIGTITGTLFDASDVSGCTPAEMAASPLGGATFNLSPNPNPLTWPIISGTAPSVTTNGSGVYNQQVYASLDLPAIYSFDYSALIGSGLVAGVKNECGPSLATVVGNITNDQVVTKNTGFWRVYNGWWQTVGGSVYAKSGVRSFVPASAAAVDQKLLKASSGALGSRTGLLVYGIPWTGLELGTNPNMLLPTGVSDNQWRVESIYNGQRYDYEYYNTRMDVFASTAWDGVTFAYNDGGLGYQILKRSGLVTLNSPLVLTSGQKVIALVDGNVVVNSNITVPDGAFLAVIASGSITFNSSLTSATIAQGWFVGNSINIPGNGVLDFQFLGEGSFVGWSGISLSRDMKAGNNLSPAEKFTYRPDMVINAPAPIKIYPRHFSPFIP